MASVSNSKKKQAKFKPTWQCKEKSNSEEQLGFGHTPLADGTLGDKHNSDKHLSDAQDWKSYLNKMYFIELCVFTTSLQLRTHEKEKQKCFCNGWSKMHHHHWLNSQGIWASSSALAVQTQSCCAVMQLNTLWEIQQSSAEIMGAGF